MEIKEVMDSLKNLKVMKEKLTIQQHKITEEEESIKNFNEQLRKRISRLIFTDIKCVKIVDNTVLIYFFSSAEITNDKIQTIEGRFIWRFDHITIELVFDRELRMEYPYIILCFEVL